ncbi:MAG TPA: antibiotic biosynthesis monooxygenase [Planctomycetota bacterium]|nr:antibiotic biosynthesis monooxygenase [Planctomycetota bacterium]
MMEARVSVRPDPVFRVDRFVVPQDARDEFLARVRETHVFLRDLRGFLGDLVLEQVSGPGESTFFTLVGWDDASSVEEAKAAVQARHEEGDDPPRRLFARLGIRADRAEYRLVDP